MVDIDNNNDQNDNNDNNANNRNNDDDMPCNSNPRRLTHIDKPQRNVDNI